MTYKTGQRFRFVVFSDVHLGHRLASINNFKREVIDRYKDDKDTYFFDLSDCCDMIVAQTGDKRFKPSMIEPRYLVVDNPVDLQIEDYCDLLAPIADRVLGICSSNHHDKILSLTGTDPTRRICYTLWKGTEAERRFLGWENFVGIRFSYANSGHRTRTLSWYLSHGATTGGRTEGGHITSLGNIAMNYGECDIYAFGHNHQLETWDRIQLIPCYKTEREKSKRLIRLNTGTYQRSRSRDQSVSYPEGKSMKPNSIGHIEAEVTFKDSGMEIVTTKRMIL